MRQIVLAGVFVLLATNGVFGGFGAQIFDPEFLNTNAGTDSEDDFEPHVTTDGSGNWVAVWHSTESAIGGGIGTDSDILVTRSTDNGASWTPPEPLNTDAETDSRFDERPHLATDGSGNWIAAWASGLLASPGTDVDILASRSTDNGASWSPPQALNINADTDNAFDYPPHLTTDGSGNWVAVWESLDWDESIPDSDILVARSADNGASWSPPQVLNSNAASDSHDGAPNLTTDGSGNWIAVWGSTESAIGGGIGTDGDILVARSTDNGASWSPPEPLNTNAGTDSGSDGGPELTTDGSGNWVAAWRSTEAAIGGGIGTDQDILVARSTDDGASWSPPDPLNTTAGTDSTDDFQHRVATNESGNWVAVWYSRESVIGGGIGTDRDILVARSTDNGASWSPPEPLNTDAGTDSRADLRPHLTTDGSGNWVAVWEATELGGFTDFDILVARFVFCAGLVDDIVYGRRLFPPQCALDASGLPGSPGEDYVYDSKTSRINRGANDSFYLSSNGLSFAPLVVDDAVRCNGQDCGLGPYDYQPGVPPLVLNVPIENNLVPEPAHALSETLIPVGNHEVIFELLDTQREIYGNTALYLVRDCGIYVDEDDAGRTRLNWISHDVEIEGFQSDLDVVSGTVSELRADRDFSNACDLGTFVNANQAVDTRLDPALGDAYYYLVSGTCAAPIGYGDSPLIPDPRDDLPPATPCP